MLMAGQRSVQATSKIQIEQELRQLNDEWVKALVRGDGETLERIMADDFFFAYPMEGVTSSSSFGMLLRVVLRSDSFIREMAAVGIGETRQHLQEKASE